MEDIPLIDLLDRTRLALLAGDLAALPDLAARTEAALQDLHLTDAGSVARIAQAAERNAACLNAAGAGLRAARQKLAEIGHLTRSVGYDGAGRRVGIGGPAELARRL